MTRRQSKNAREAKMIKRKHSKYQEKTVESSPLRRMNRLMKLKVLERMPVSKENISQAGRKNMR